MEPNSFLPEAPGSKAARHCGIWALIALLPCFPISIVLAIIAIVQDSKAKQLARSHPDEYRKPSSAGLTMGIVSLALFPVVSIFELITAIAIPAMLGQRDRAKDKVATTNVVGPMGDLLAKYDLMQTEKRSNEETLKAMESHLKEVTKFDKNPWNRATPAYLYTIAVVRGLDEQGIDDAAKLRATELGQCAFVIQFPEEQGSTVLPGYLAGAVKLKHPNFNGASVYVKHTTLE